MSMTLPQPGEPNRKGTPKPSEDPVLLKAFLCGSFSRQKQFRDVRAAMIATRKIHCTSRWLDEVMQEAFLPIHLDQDLTRQGSEGEFGAAKRDRDDIRTSDVIVMQSEQFQTYTTGGRLDEWGYAKGINDACIAMVGYAPIHRILVGRRENIFHVEPDIILVETWEEALKVMVKMAADLSPQRYSVPDMLLGAVRHEHLAMLDERGEIIPFRNGVAAPNRYRKEYRWRLSEFRDTVNDIKDKEKELGKTNAKTI